MEEVKLTAAPTDVVIVQSDERSEPGPEVDLQYAIDDNPPWYLCILLGFQVGSIPYHAMPCHTVCESDLNRP